MDMKQVATEILEVLKIGLVSGSQKISEQFPILCKQVLRWGIIENICTILLSVSVMSICYKLTLFAIAKQQANKYDGEMWLFLSIPSIVAIIVFFIIFWFSMLKMGKILSAPNVYLLDYFKSLINPTTT